MELQTVNRNEKRIIVQQYIVDFFNENEKTNAYYEELCQRQLKEDPHFDFIFYETIERDFFTHYLYHHEIFNDFLAQLYQHHRNLIQKYAGAGSENQSVVKQLPGAIEMANQEIIEYLDGCEEKYRL